MKTRSSIKLNRVISCRFIFDGKGDYSYRINNYFNPIDYPGNSTRLGTCNVIVLDPEYVREKLYLKEVPHSDKEKWSVYRLESHNDDSYYTVVCYSTRYYKTYVTDIIKKQIQRNVFKSLGLTYAEPEFSSRIIDGGKTSERCETFDYLSSIIQDCPEVRVQSQSKLPLMDFLLNEGELSDYTWLLDSTHANYRLYQLWKPMTGMWKTPATIEQYRALSLMQSYTPFFSSCQHIDLTKLPVENAKCMVTNGIRFHKASMRRTSFKVYQELDFHEGLCTRYFQTEDGFIKSRFNKYRTELGREVLNNFYNCTMQNLIIEGRIYNRKTSDDNFNGISYYN